MLGGKGKRIGILVILIAVVGLLVGWSYMQRQLPTENNPFWLVSGHYDSNGNETYSIMLGEVNFTFLYVEEMFVTDVPIPVHFMVEFPDGTIEYLENTIGGMLKLPPRIVMSDHLTPQAAIVSAYDDSHEGWYGWYYAISL